MTIQLWLDDTRQPSRGFTWAKTAEKAIELLKTGKVNFASLDHDLNIGQSFRCETGTIGNKCDGKAASFDRAGNH
jgi:hypothetical protein